MSDTNEQSNSLSAQNQGLVTVVVPAAGLGTRFLPTTKVVPKELLPVISTPGIEYIAQEAADAGATRLAVITNEEKKSLIEYFEPDPELEDTLKARGKTDIYNRLVSLHNIIDVVPVFQEEPKGLGHAIAQAEQALDDSEQYFSVMLPDDLVQGGVMTDMENVRKSFGGTVLCAAEVPDEDVSSYGIFEVDDTDDPHVKRVLGMVEKPDLADAPSNLAATGRYLLDRGIFAALAQTEPGKGGEIQITDAIARLIDDGEPVHVIVHDGVRHDLGNPAGYIRACVDFALNDPQYGPSLNTWLQDRLKG